MHHRLPLLAARMLNEPLLIHPGKAQIIVNVLRDRLGVGEIVGVTGSHATIFGFDEDLGDDYGPDPYDLVSGIAVIPVEGTLVQKNGTVRPYSGMTGYDGIRNAYLTALADPLVGAIALQIDSPGGEVAGCFDLCDTIAANRGRKPCWAILDEGAYSAAYAIASAADRIVVPRTGGVGSIGVIAMLADLSGALSKAGVRVNIIQFGARKADGNPYEALPDAARDRFQAKIDALGQIFVETVARNRGIAAETVQGTEAAVLMPAEALKLGLADAVMDANAAMAALHALIAA